MTNTDPFQNIPTAPPDSDGKETHLIAAALIYPHTASASPLAANLFGAAVHAGMSSIGFEAGCPLSFGGPIWIGCLCRVVDRNRGLLAMLASLMQLRIGGIHYPIKVGFFDNAEAVWRSVSFDGPKVPDFSQFITPDIGVAWTDRLQREADAMRAGLQAGIALAKSQPFDGPETPPPPTP